MNVQTFEEYINEHGIFKLNIGDRFRPYDNIFNMREVPPRILDIRVYQRPFYGLTHCVKYTAKVARGYMEQSINLQQEELDLTRQYYWNNLTKEQQTFLERKILEEYSYAYHNL